MIAGADDRAAASLYEHDNIGEEMNRGGWRPMTERQLVRFGLNGIAGFLSFAVMGYGLYSAMRIDVRFNPVPSTLYYILPIASFPVFVFGFVWRKSAVIQAILALAYVVVCVFLSWRQCSSFGYCTGVASIVLLEITTRQALAFIGAAIASLVAMAMGERG